MSFEQQQPEVKKTKQELINTKMEEAEKIQEEIDNLLDSMPEGETKEKLKEKTAKLKKVYAEVAELIAD